MKKYFIQKGETQEGPFDIDELKTKQILPDTPIWFDPLKEWKTAGEIEELKCLFVFTPPPFVKSSIQPLDKSLSTSVWNKQRLVILISAALGMIATFLPWVNAPILGSIAGTKGDGWFTFVLYLIPLVIALIGKQIEPIKAPIIYTAVIPSVIASIVGIWKIKDFNSVMGETDSSNSISEAINASTSIGFGLYLVVLAGIGVAFAALFIKDKTTA